MVICEQSVSIICLNVYVTELLSYCVTPLVPKSAAVLLMAGCFVERDMRHALCALHVFLLQKVKNDTCYIKCFIVGPSKPIYVYCCK